MMFGGLAAELLGHALHVGAARLATTMPARVEPVNDTMSTSGMRRERRADRRAVAVDEVEHARRHAGFVQDLGEDDRVERRDLASASAPSCSPPRAPARPCRRSG